MVQFQYVLVVMSVSLWLSMIFGVALIVVEKRMWKKIIIVVASVILFVNALGMTQFAIDANASPIAIHGKADPVLEDVLAMKNMSSDMRGIRTIHVDDDIAEMIVRDPAVGEYVKNAGTIYVKETGCAETYLHEIGHAVWYNVLNSTQREQYAKYHKNTTWFPSSYGATSTEEDFAEAYALYREGWRLDDWRTRFLDAR